MRWREGEVEGERGWRERERWRKGEGAAAEKNGESNTNSDLPANAF